MDKRKLIAPVLALGIAASSVVPAFAQESKTPETRDGNGSNETGLELDKKATLEDDGTYTIELSAYGTGSTFTVPSKGKPLDIALVIDESGSIAKNGRLEGLRTAVTNFVNSISADSSKNNADHRISIIGFAQGQTGNPGDEKYHVVSPGSDSTYWLNTGIFIDGQMKNYKQAQYDSRGNVSGYKDLTAQDYQDALVSVNNADGSVNSSITTAIGNIGSKGGTRTQYGIEMANNVFENNPINSEERDRIVVVFSDGEPGGSDFENSEARAALAKAYDTKNSYNAKVFTVMLDSSPSTDCKRFMDALSSNRLNIASFPYKTNGYIYTVVKPEQLNKNSTYYIENGDLYRDITYSQSRNSWGYNSWGSWRTVNVDTTKVYARTADSSNGLTNGKYYMQVSNTSELDNIFTLISSEVTNPKADVEMNGSAVLRDILADGFILPGTESQQKSKISTYIEKGSVKSGSSSVQWSGVEEEANYSVSIDGQNIDVTGFDYSDKYIGPLHSGEKLIVRISGVLPTEQAVQNAIIPTNDGNSGVYPNSRDANAGVNGVKFPVPETILTKKAVVVDYAKPLKLNGNSFDLENVKFVSNSFAKDTNAVNPVTEYGEFSVDKSNDFFYTPKTMKWTGTDKAFAFGKTSDSSSARKVSANTNGNLWTQMTVIPANNVYYEDSFEFKNENGESVGIEYTGNWAIEGTETGAGFEASEVHGKWEDVDHLNGTVGDSGGSSHVGEFTSEKSTKASFTFTGTGFDIYSRTNLASGTVVANIRDEAGEFIKALIIDTKSKSDTFYNIPTLSWTASSYGTYSVELIVTDAAAHDGGRKMFYLDGIRVYNPLGSNTEHEDSYANEHSATFHSLKDLLDKDSIAFIDEDSNGQASIGKYSDSAISELSPRNEVYLNTGQTVVINAPRHEDAATQENTVYYIGVKSPDGKLVKLTVSDDGGTKDIVTKSTIDMYYPVVPAPNGTIVITHTPISDKPSTQSNEGQSTTQNIAALTKLRIASKVPAAAPVTDTDFSISEETALASYAAFKEASVNTPSDDTESDDNSEILPPEDVDVDNGDDDKVESGKKPWWKWLFGGLISIFD